MKPIAKVALIGAGTFVVGAAIFGVALGIAYANRDESATKRDDAHYALAKETTISKIDLSLSADSIRIQTGDVETVTIDYKDRTENPIFNISFADGILTMNEKAFNQGDWFRFKWPWEITQRNLVTVTVPSSLDITYKLVSVSGAVVASNVTSSSSFTATSTSGALELSNSTFGGKVTLSSTSGAVAMTKVKSEDSIYLSSVSGAAAATDVEAKDTLSLSSTSGSVSGTKTKSRDFIGKSVSGKVSFNQGSVENSITASSTSGSILIGVLGDDTYKVTHSTVSGSANIEVRTDPGATKTISAKTISGSISVKYASL